MNPKQLSRSIAVTVLLLVVTTAFAQRQMENLGRGVIALRQSTDSVFVSWRMLGTDPDNIAFKYTALPATLKSKLKGLIICL